MQKRVNDIFDNFLNARTHQNFDILAKAEPELFGGKEIKLESKILLGGMLRPLFSKETQPELIMISAVALPKDFPVSFPKAKPVRLEKSTPAFINSRLVAVFPENWKDNHTREYSLYFVDRFMLRTTAAIRDLKTQITGLNRLFQIDTSDRAAFESLSAQWVTLHENFHSTGKLPYPKNVKIKSSLYSSAIEELRVDLLSIQWCHNNNYLLLSEFIFFERVLRYGVDGSIENDCDSISSHVALSYLLQHNQLNIKDNKVNFLTTATKNILGLLAEIENFEEKNTELNFRDAAKIFCQSYLNTNMDSINKILRKNRNKNV